MVNLHHFAENGFDDLVDFSDVSAEDKERLGKTMKH